jgi:hypothetical protein
MAYRYTKALEHIRKYRKEQATSLQVHQANLNHLKQNKEKAAEVRACLCTR